jgi:hypothetical protein
MLPAPALQKPRACMHRLWREWLLDTGSCNDTGSSGFSSCGSMPPLTPGQNAQRDFSGASA